jgi:ABC-type transport system involved in multi-copper enzyme maturation permease subunit
MTATLRRIVWEQRVRLPLLLALSAVWGLLIVLIFDTADPRQRDLSAQPGNVAVAARVLGIDPLAAWVSLGQLHPVFLVASCVFAVGLGIRSVAGELEEGTLELALARPIRRRDHLLAYLLALAPGCLLLAAAFAAGAVLADAVFDPPGAPLAIGRMLLAALGSTLLLAAVAALAVLVSSLHAERGRALAWALGILLVMYAGAFLLPLWSPAAPLARLSLFWYFTPGPIIQDGAVPWRDWAALAAFTALAVAGAIRVFTRRDLAS